MINKAPEKVIDFIDEYFNLPLGGKKVRCPYHINAKRHKQRMGLRVLIGKGTPREIVQESLIYEKLRGVDFQSMSKTEIREFMVKRHIGVDCSGLAVHVLNKWLNTIGKKSFWKYIKFPKIGLYRKIAIKLRPVENIPANLLTGDLNTYKISNYNNVKPGDLIRSKIPKRRKNLKDIYHVMLITEVIKEMGEVSKFKYVNSVRGYEDKHGVRYGEVIVKDSERSLQYQEWTDSYKGKNWTFDEILSDPEYAQIRRFRFVPLY
jgi:hypothetical protein